MPVSMEDFFHFMCEFLEMEVKSPYLPLSTSAVMTTYSTYYTPCHHKQLGPLLSSRQKLDEWQVLSELCQVTQLKIHDTEPSNTTVEHICQCGRALQNRDHTLFIRASKMSQRRGLTVLSAWLPWTIVGLCCSSLFLFVGPLFFLAFVILT